MSIRDIIKNSFIEGFNNNIPSLKLMLVCLLAALLLGFYIYMAYRITCADSFYSAEFNLSLVMVSIITCAIILTIQSSVIVSLGMVGALSIVRFRTAVKNSIDLVFLFWAICIGIITGTSLIGLAILVSLILSVLLVIFKFIPAPKNNTFFISVEAGDPESVKIITECIKKFDSHYHLMSQNLSSERLTFTAQVRLNDPTDVMQELNKCDGIRSVSVIAHGENTSI